MAGAFCPPETPAILLVMPPEGSPENAALKKNAAPKLPTRLVPQMGSTVLFPQSPCPKN
jgi:hypothetical protein